MTTTTEYIKGSKVLFEGWTTDHTSIFGFEVSPNEVGILADLDIDRSGTRVWLVIFPTLVKKVNGHRGGKLTRTVEMSRRVQIDESDLIPAP